MQDVKMQEVNEKGIALTGRNITGPP